MKKYEITPEQVGLQRCRREDLQGGDPEDNARIARAILSGQRGPKRDAVLMNAGAALYIGQKADTMQEGIALAAELIDSGRALKTLEAVTAASRM